MTLNTNFINYNYWELVIPTANIYTSLESRIKLLLPKTMIFEFSITDQP